MIENLSGFPRHDCASCIFPARDELIQTIARQLSYLLLQPFVANVVDWTYREIAVLTYGPWFQA
jgi:hypothetical protein